MLPPSGSRPIRKMAFEEGAHLRGWHGRWVDMGGGRRRHEVTGPGGVSHVKESKTAFTHASYRPPEAGANSGVQFHTSEAVARKRASGPFRGGEVIPLKGGGDAPRKLEPELSGIDDMAARARRADERRMRQIEQERQRKAPTPAPKPKASAGGTVEKPKQPGRSSHPAGARAIFGRRHDAVLTGNPPHDVFGQEPHHDIMVKNARGDWVSSSAQAKDLEVRTVGSPELAAWAKAAHAAHSHNRNAEHYRDVAERPASHVEPPPYISNERWVRMSEAERMANLRPEERRMAERAQADAKKRTTEKPMPAVPPALRTSPTPAATPKHPSAPVGGKPSGGLTFKHRLGSDPNGERIDASAHVKTLDEAKEHAARFPKSVGVKATTLSTSTPEKQIPGHPPAETFYSEHLGRDIPRSVELGTVYFHADLRSTGVTGQANETGMKRWERFQHHVKRLGHTIEPPPVRKNALPPAGSRPLR